MSAYPRHSEATFPVRRPPFAFEELPQDWVQGDLLSSAFFMSLFASFPDGEQFFIRSVRQHRDLASSRAQQADISAFIGQEAVHGHAHSELNDHLRRQGFDVDALLKRVNFLLETGEKHMSPADCLVATAALEHLTAVLARLILAEPAQRERFANTELQKLIEWHALEESEHKAVAFNLMASLNVSLGRRATLMLSASTALVGYLAWSTRHLYQSRTGHKPGLREYAGLARTLFGRQGLVRKALPEYLQWFRPGFHPDQERTHQLEQQARLRLGLEPA